MDNMLRRITWQSKEQNMIWAGSLTCLQIKPYLLTVFVLPLNNTALGRHTVSCNCFIVYLLNISTTRVTSSCHAIFHGNKEQKDHCKVISLINILIMKALVDFPLSDWLLRILFRECWSNLNCSWLYITCHDSILIWSGLLEPREDLSPNNSLP